MLGVAVENLKLQLEGHIEHAPAQDHELRFSLRNAEGGVFGRLPRNAHLRLELGCPLSRALVEGLQVGLRAQPSQLGVDAREFVLKREERLSMWCGPL